MVNSSVIALILFLNIIVILILIGKFFAKKETLPEKIDILNERISILSAKIDQLDKRIDSQDKKIENIENIIAIIANSQYLLGAEDFMN